MHPTCPAEFFIFNSVSFVVLKVFEELSHVELFRSVLIDKQRQETEIFNYFAKKMSAEDQKTVAKAAKRSLKWIKKCKFSNLF